MRLLSTRTYNDQLQELIEEYREHNAGEFTLQEVATWAIRAGKWKPQSRSLVKQLVRELGQAARVEYITDPQGRRVRKLHARRERISLPTGEEVQQTFWDDIRTAAPAHMLLAFQQRRRFILSDCHQLQTDVESYNENWNKENPIQMVFDFTEDLEEMKLPSDYPHFEEDEENLDDHFSSQSDAGS